MTRSFYVPTCRNAIKHHCVAHFNCHSFMEQSEIMRRHVLYYSMNNEQLIKKKTLPIVHCFSASIFFCIVCLSVCVFASASAFSKFTSALLLSVPLYNSPSSVK